MNRILRISAEDLDATVEAGVTRLQLTKALAQHRAHVPRRSWRRRDDRRHGGDARLGHDGRALRHDARERAGAHRRARRRTGRHAPARARASRRPATTSRACSSDRRARSASSPKSRCGCIRCRRPFRGGRLRVRLDGGRRRDRHRHDSARRAGRAHRAARRGVRWTRSTATRRRAIRSRRRCSSNFTATASGTSPSRPRPRRRWPPERGGRGFKWATRLEDRERLWQARHDALYAALALRPGSRAWTTDVCVPISRLAECIVETEADHADASFPVCLVGHAGDGNFHLIYVLDPASAPELDGGKAPQRAAGHARARDGRHVHRRARRRATAREVSRPNTARASR